MILKINCMYPTETGYIIPRSHFTENKPQFAIFEVLSIDGPRYIVEHKVYAPKEIKYILKASKKEKIEIL